MRLWHVDLLQVLPRKLLISQWRECCAIARAIAKHGTPNHPLVNKVLSSRGDFIAYTSKVHMEMWKRCYKVNTLTCAKFDHNVNAGKDYFKNCTVHRIIFTDWFTERYLMQCFYNLQEKYDCGMITAEEWEKIQSHVYRLIMKNDVECSTPTVENSLFKREAEEYRARTKSQGAKHERN
jgi:uncharacterized protein (TIGR02328 family)